MGTSSSDVPVTKVTPEGEYPGVFNTLIPYDNFYLQIGTSRLKAKDIIGMWRYIHNRFLDLLRQNGFIDKFGRTKYQADTALDKLYRLFWRKELIAASFHMPVGYVEQRYWLNRLAKIIIQDIILASTESIEWMRIYPPDMLIAPILQDLHKLVSGDNTLRLQKIDADGKNMIPFEYRLKYVDKYRLGIDNDVDSDRNMITFKMDNQYGSSVKLVIKSNTRNFDNFIEMINDRLSSDRKVKEVDEYLKSFVFSFELTRETSRKRKLLLSVISMEPESMK